MTQHEFQTEVFLSASNSFGQTRKPRKVELDVTVGIKDNGDGWFELYDIETGGDDWYAEGGLWFDGKTLTDYDGIFELPKFIVDKLNELGYDVSDF